MTKFISGVSLNGAPLSHVLFVDPEIGEAVLAEEYWLPLERRGEPIEDPSSLWGFQTLTVKGQITVEKPASLPEVASDYDYLCESFCQDQGGLGSNWSILSDLCPLCSNNPCVCCCHP